MTTIAPYFATKYDSAAHEVIAILADHAEGYGQGFGGNIDAPTGYFELVILDESHDADFHDHTNYSSPHSHSPAQACLPAHPPQARPTTSPRARRVA